MRLPIRLSPFLVPAILVCAFRTSPAPAQPVGPEFRVNSYTTNSQRSARVAADSGGGFVVVWLSFLQDGSGNGIFGQRFCGGLPMVTPPSPLTTTQTLCM